MTDTTKSLLELLPHGAPILKAFLSCDGLDGYVLFIHPEGGTLQRLRRVSGRLRHDITFDIANPATAAAVIQAFERFQDSPFRVERIVDFLMNDIPSVIFEGEEPGIAMH